LGCLRPQEISQPTINGSRINTPITSTYVVYLALSYIVYTLSYYRQIGIAWDEQYSYVRFNSGSTDFTWFKKPKTHTTSDGLIDAQPSL